MKGRFNPIANLILLATNTHCVVAMQTFERSGMRPFLVMNRAPTRRYEIVRSVRQQSGRQRECDTAESGHGSSQPDG